jgi:hypothetical protein
MNSFEGKSRNPFQFIVFGLDAFLIIIIFLLIFQIFYNQSYDLLIFLFIVAFDLVVASIFIFLLVFKLSLWFKDNKNFYELVYIISFSMVFLSLIFAAIGLTQELISRPQLVTPISDPWDRMSTVKPVYYDLYRATSLISFGFIWISTSLFLKNYLVNYSKRSEKWKYWILSALPLIYYLITSDYIINNILNILIFQYPSFTSVFFYILGSTKQIGGFFFALPLFFMARNSINVNLKFCLQLFAIGIMILYSSIQISTLHVLPFPPFGLITLSNTLIASYLVFIGLTYSAKSVSDDRKLLNNLKKQFKDDSHSFLNAIGSAEWNKNLEITTQKLIKQVSDNRNSESNLKEDDIKSYIADLMDEIKESKTPK